MVYGLNRSAVVDPPLQASLPKMSEKMRKIFEFRIFALAVHRHHQEEYFCQVLWKSDLMVRNYKGNSVFSVYSIETRKRISDVKTLQNSLHMWNRMFTFFKSSSCAIDLKFPTMLLEGLIYFPDIFLSRGVHTQVPSRAQVKVRW